MTALLFAILVQAVDLDAVRSRADALLEEAKAGYETARTSSSVKDFVEAGFKLEEARIKFLVLQEIGGADLQKLSADRLRAVNQLNKLINEGKLAVMNASAPKAAEPAAPDVPPPPPTAGPAIDVTKRAAVPDAAKQKEAEKQVKEVFKNQYARKAPADRVALARTLLAQAAKSGDDPAAAWVLCREAQDVAVQACQVDWIVAAVDETSRVFDIDGLSMKAAALSAAGKSARTPPEFIALTEAVLRLIDDLMAADQYDTADKSAVAALQYAKRTNDAQQLRRATARVKDVTDARAKFKTLNKTLQTLAQKPDDPAANDEVGQFHCFIKGNWDLGLRFLTKSSDGDLRTLAAREVVSGDTVEVADGWWDLAQKEKSPLRKSQILQHARTIYERALPNATALARLKIEKRLAEIGDPAGGGGTPVGMAAWWRFDEKAGASAADATGKSNTLVLSNGASWGEGRSGGALVLDGKGARGTAGDTTFMNVDRDSFSVACFVKLNGTAPGRIINKWDVSAPPHGWLLDVNTGVSVGGGIPGGAPGSVRVRLSDGGSGAVDYVLDAGLGVGTWKHLAFTADFKGEGLKIYVDGNQIGKTQSLAAFSGSLNTSTPLSVGWLPGSMPTPNYLSGTIDDLRLYRRILTPVEVRELTTRK
jgi:hypothetical protein